jgi:polygalacturonase
MFRVVWITSLVAGMWGFGPAMACAQATLPADFSVARPTIPDRTFTIANFGAVGDGQTFSTGAIERAILACEKVGGGTVDVPAGKFLTGPFQLASNLNLHLEKGSTLLFSNNPKDYGEGEKGLQNGMTIAHGHDIAITGEGAIDGQGAFFWRRHFEGDPDAPRPRLIQLTECSRVLVQDVTLMNSPSFHLVPAQCQNVTIENIHIKSPALSPNTDGIDPSGINFLIRGCTIDTGDDCIALKAGAQYDVSRPSCENFLITDCTFLHGHGMSVGSESYGGVRNMIVRNCTFDGTDAGIRLKSPRGRGGLVENLTYEHLKMRNVKNSILITSYYPRIPAHPDKDPAQTVGARTPQWRHIRISDVTSTGGLIAGQIVGLPEMPIEDILFSNVNILAVEPIEIVNARSIQFTGCKILGSSGKPSVLNASVVGLN